MLSFVGRTSIRAARFAHAAAESARADETRSRTARSRARRMSSSGLGSRRGGDRPAELSDALVRLVPGEGKRRSEADRGGAGREADHAVLETRRQRAVVRSLVGQVDREEEAASADVGDGSGELFGHFPQPAEEVFADRARVLDQVLLFDDLEILLAAHHVHEVPAPRRVDPGRNLEDVVHVIDAVVRGEPADLSLLAEAEEVRLDSHLLPAPHGPGQSDPGLNLVEDEKELELVGERSQAPEELRAEMVVAALALNRLQDQRGDVVRVVRAGLSGLALVP